jgi:DNA-binding response OmpR family regulator
MPTHILVVDDEVSIHELVAEYLRGRGWTVDVARDGREARALLAGGRYDVMLTDLKLPDVEGLELVRHAARRLPPVPGVVMTGYATVDGVVRALRLGAADFVLKPFKLRDLFTLLEGAVTRAQQQRDTAAATRAVEFFEAAELAADRASALALTGLLVDAVAAMEGVAYVEIARGGTPLVQLGTRSGESTDWPLPGDHLLRVHPSSPRVAAYALAAERALRRGGF